MLFKADDYVWFGENKELGIVYNFNFNGNLFVYYVRSILDMSLHILTSEQMKTLTDKEIFNLKMAQ